MTLFNIFLKGGPIMFVLLIVSMIGLSLVIEKYRQIFKINKIHKKLAQKLHEAVTIEEIGLTLKYIPDECPLNIVIKKMLSLLNEDFSVIKDSIEATANIAIHKLEYGLGWLSTIAAVAPLIGFLGTVTGMIRVFINIAAHSQQGIDLNMLASGIWEALLTTVGGLVVGIPMIILYNDLVSHTQNNAKLLQEQIDELMIKLHRR